MMTDEQLAAIRAAWRTYAGPLEPAIQHVRVLLAEVERLRERDAAMRAIVQAVADGATTYRDREDEYCTQDVNCMWRSPGQGKPFQMVHTDRCIVTKARALLAAEQELPT